MKNIYKLLKFNRFIKNETIKNLGIFLLHLTGKRYFGIFLDPIFMCNLRCKMCYFSDEKQRKEKQSRALTLEEIEKIANAFFHRALKLQIGCGAEPSLFKLNRELILLGKQKRIPYVSMTTNANRITKEDWTSFLDAGLDEVTLSLHGVKKETYEYFMTNASYEAFLSSLKALTELKVNYPDFKIRINYTVNQDNLQELADLFEVFDEYSIDILQLRPIQNLGNTEYQDFSWNALIEQYDKIVNVLRENAIRKKILFIAPAKEDLTKTENESSAILDSTYFYISSRSCWKHDFDLNKDSFESYSKRTGLTKKLWKKIFQKDKNYTKRKLNYDIR